MLRRSPKRDFSFGCSSTLVCADRLKTWADCQDLSARLTAPHNQHQQRFPRIRGAMERNPALARFPLVSEPVSLARPNDVTDKAAGLFAMPLDDAYRASRWMLAAEEPAFAEELEASSAEHLAFDHLDPVDVTFHRTRSLSFNDSSVPLIRSREPC